jgi:hypothetical protein
VNRAAGQSLPPGRTTNMSVLVRDVMTIGVPVCRDTEGCGVVAGRLGRLAGAADVVVALDSDGMACGWTTRARLLAEPPERPVAEVLDEDIPQVPPDIPAAAARQLMVDRGLEALFLMHAWPGEPRPSAVITRAALEARLEQPA